MSPRLSSISRYRRVPDVATVDRLGRATTSRDLRPLPDQPGTFLHTVSDSDRLDHLAFKYFDQSRDWWRILDANPSFVDPETLLGDVRFVEALLPISWAGPEPRWAELPVALAALPGVTFALVGTDEEPVPVVSVTDGPTAFTILSALAADLDESVRSQMLTVPLAGALAGNVVLSATVRFAVLAPGAWRIVDLANHAIWTFRLDPTVNLILAMPGTLQFSWWISVEFNRALLGPSALRNVATGLGFEVGPEAEIRRIGKPIVVPPRTA